MTTDWNWIRDRDVKARQPHRCLMCGENILIGEIYCERTGTQEEKMITMRMHKECEKESNKWDEDDWHTFDTYEMPRPDPTSKG